VKPHSVHGHASARDIALRSIAMFASLAAACTPPPVWIGTLHTTSNGPEGSTTAVAPDTDNEPVDDSITMAMPGTTTNDEGEASSESLPPPSCNPVDMLLVVDNSMSMSTYQLALAEAIPSFVMAMHEGLPPSIDVHVGITTTEFDTGCDAGESTEMCQTHASFEEVEAHYIRPDVMNDGGNGSQGRLFEYASLTYYTTDSEADPTGLAEWLLLAMQSTGLVGCSFEMPVAAAGFSAHPANAAANAGFLRPDATLLVFLLTDEPDKSLETDESYRDMLIDAKPGCGEACIFIGAIVPSCIEDVNQKLWQFMNQFPAAPIWGDIEDVNGYANVLDEAFMTALANACA